VDEVSCYEVVLRPTGTLAEARARTWLVT